MFVLYSLDFQERCYCIVLYWGGCGEVAERKVSPYSYGRFGLWCGYVVFSCQREIGGGFEYFLVVVRVCIVFGFDEYVFFGEEIMGRVCLVAFGPACMVLMLVSS